MTLQRQIVRFPLGLGVDTKTDDNELPLGKLVALENATFETPKKLRKRPGQDLLTATPLAAGALAAFVRDDNELLMVDGNNVVNSYAGEVTPAAPWTPKGLLPSVTATVRPLGTTQYSAGDVDLAKSTSGLVCSVCTLVDQAPGGGLLRRGVSYSIYDSNTGSVLVPPTVLDSNPASALPRVVYSNGNFCIYWLVNISSAASIVGTTISASAPTTPPAAPTTITSGSTTLAISNTSANCVFDVIASDSFGAIYLAFTNNSATLTILKFANTAPLVAALSVINGTAAPQVVSLAADLVNSSILVAWTDSLGGGSPSYAVYSFSSLGQLVSNTSIVSGLTPIGFYYGRITAVVQSGFGYVFASGLIFSFDGTRNVGDVVTRAIFVTSLSGSNLSVVGPKTKLIGSLSIGGKAFAANGGYYVPAWFYADAGNRADTQSGLYIVDVKGNVVASSLRGDCGATAAAFDFSSPDSLFISACGSSIVNSTTTIVTCAQAISTRLSATPSTSNEITNQGTILGSSFFKYQYGPAAAEFDFLHGSASEFMSSEIAQTLHVSGSLPYMYDGTNSVEHGFLQYPWAISASASVGGTLTLLATYGYAVTYEWMDALGHVHRSAPGFLNGSTITLTGSQRTVTLAIPTLRCSQKTNVQITVWRTLANGSVYFQVNNFNNFGSLFNDKNADRAGWIDTLADTDIQAAPRLYTTGGVLANGAPNPIGPLVVHRNRIFAVDSTNPLVVQYTQQVISPAPAEWSPFNVMNVDPRGGATTALGSLDDKLIAFKMNRIFVIYGQGPDSTGGQNDFTDTLPVTTDTGCDSPKSVVNVPDGIMFHSPKGFYLLNRALQMQYIGYDVDAFNSDVVLGAEVMPDRHQVRFTTRDMVFGGTRQLVYDYVVGQWSVYTEPVSFIIYGNAVGSVIWQDRLVLGRVVGFALIEDLPSSTSFSDAGTYIPIKFQTGWLSFADIQGAQRLYKLQILGTYKSPHRLTVSLAFDNGPVTQTQVITVSDPMVPYQLAIKPKTQRCQSVQITIEDSGMGATGGEGFDFSSLAGEFGIQGRLRLLRKSQTYG